MPAAATSGRGRRLLALAHAGLRRVRLRRIAPARVIGWPDAPRPPRQCPRRVRRPEEQRLRRFAFFGVIDFYGFSFSALTGAGRDFRSVLLTAHEAGASKAELARALGISRQRVDEVLTRARHERAVGVEDVTD
jgi:hypothetical protein